MKVAVVGGGIFGVTAALALKQRGHQVALFAPGTIPHPLASSTDISKLVRMDYGGDDLYTVLAEEAREGWHRLNATWGEPLYHEDGLIVMTSRPMSPGSFEFESFERHRRRGRPVERLSSADLTARFPAWAAERYVDGYFNPQAGWAASGKVLARLGAELAPAGVTVHEDTTVVGLYEEGSSVVGIVTARGTRHHADIVIVAAGAWTPVLLPALANRLRVVGQPVIHLRPTTPGDYSPPQFTCWVADIARTGWYGFPAVDSVVKLANHGPGRIVHPDAPREVSAEEIERCRSFLGETFPSLAEAPLVYTRLCLYCDSWDGNFYIDHDPERPGLVVAAGDSGHAFKFAPVLGPLIADAVERKPNPYSERFAWRERGSESSEAARHTER